MKPVPFPQAFRSDSAEGYMSQAAILIGMRYRLWPYAHEARPAIASDQRRIDFRDVLTGEEEKTLNIPRVKELGERIGDAGHGEALRHLQAQSGRPLGLQSPESKEPALERIARIAESLERDAASASAIALLLACFEHPRALVRLAAAAVYGQLYRRVEFVRPVLEDGLFESDPLTRTVAATGLALVYPDSPALGILTRPRPSPFGGARSRTSTLVHGTFARDQTWWQPRPEFNFHEYIRRDVWPDLYSLQDRFDWFGGYSDIARDIAAQDLAQWVAQHGMNGISLMCHSHGANVALHATRYGLQSAKMVLLSCPVHWPKYEPDWSGVGRIVSVRVKADLVIMLDGGGQRFRDPRIAENVIDLWFDHSTTHSPDVWRWHDVRSMI